MLNKKSIFNKNILLLLSGYKKKNLVEMGHKCGTAGHQRHKAQTIY